ncbi:MAG: DUF4169 family protein [Magnetovibrio sp.]|nr:DUF4169 family protein [Magnetovibrio sp.]
MANIINLNQFRKAKARTDKAKTAENNRVIFGQPKTEKNQNQRERRAHDRDLDGKKITDTTED